MPVGRRGRLRDPRDDRPRGAGHRPGRGDRPGAERRAASATAGRTPAGRRSAARANALDQRPADGGQPRAGRSSGDGPLRARSATCPRTATRSPTRCGPRPTRSSSRRRPITAGWRTSASTILPRPEDRPRPDPDPLQHRAAGVRPVRDRARRSSRRPTTPDATGPRLGRRDPAVPPGRPADGLGAGPGRRPAHAAPRRGRRAPDGPRRGRRRPRRRGPGRGQRRHRQQDRDVHAGRPGGPPRHPVLRLRADQLGRPRDRRRARRSRSRSARPTRSSTFRGVRIAPPGTEVRNPAFDVTPAELITGIVTEEGVVRGAVRGRPARRRPSERRARWAAMPGFHAIRPQPSHPPRPRRRRPTDGRPSRSAGAADRRPGDDRQGAPALVPRARPAATPPTRSATSRSASSRGPAGAWRWDGDAPVALVLEYNGLTPAAAVRDGPRRRRSRRPARPDPAAGRLRRGAADGPARGRDRLPGRPRARRWSGCGSTGRASGRIRRPSSGSCRSRSASSTGSTSSASRRGCRRRRSPTASTTALRVNGQLVAAAGHPRRSARAPGWRSSATS